MYQGHWSLLAIGALAFLGCKQQATSTDSHPEKSVAHAIAKTHDFPLNDDPCNDMVETKLAAWVGAWREWHQEGAQLNPPATSYLEFEGARIPENHIMVYVRAKRVLIDHSLSFELENREGQPTSTAHWYGTLSDDIFKATKKLEKLGMDASKTVIALAFEEDVKADVIRKILIFFRDRPTVLAFKAPEIEERFRVPGYVRERYAYLYEARSELKEHTWQCKEMVEFWDIIEKTPTNRRWERLQTLFGSAWVACGCKGFDMEERLVAIVMAYKLQPLATAHPLAISAEGAPFVFAQDSTWKTLAPQLLEVDSPIWPVASEVEVAPE